MGKKITVALAVFASLAALVGTYTAGYLWLGEVQYWAGGSLQRPPTAYRIYSQPWIATVFRPAAKLESWLRGAEVRATWTTDVWDDLPPVP